MPSSRGDLLTLVSDGRRGVLATLRANGPPQLSTVSYVVTADRSLLKVAVTADRAKVANVRRDPRTSLHVASEDGWSYAVVESTAELSPIATSTEDPVIDELLDIYRAVMGDHPDWRDHATTLVAERRLVLRLPIERVYGLLR